MSSCSVHKQSHANIVKCLLNIVLLYAVYWSCQFIARSSNISLRHWQQMGGVKINEDIVIDKSIHKTINSRSSVMKVTYKCFPQWNTEIVFRVRISVAAVGD